MDVPEAVAFDVFGTVVDWRTGVTRETAGFLAHLNGADRDPAEFTDAWRFRYIAIMQDYRASGRPFVTLDVLHREMLEQTLPAHDIDPARLAPALLDT